MTEEVKAPERLYVQDPAEGSANNWVFKQRSKPSDIEYVPATELARVRRALERIADGDIDCNCTHRDEFCCVKQKHYCPFCIAVVALQSRDERPQQLPASTDERQKQHEDSYWDDPLRGNFKC